MIYGVHQSTVCNFQARPEDRTAFNLFADADAISEQWEKDHPENPWKDRPKDGFNQGGYEWRVATWGVKWNVSLEDNKPTKVTEKCVKYSFSTAWNPPLPVVVAWSLKYPGLTFELRYYEGGMGFQGRYVVVNGEELVKDESSYSGSRGG
jgi:hypothetical protein